MLLVRKHETFSPLGFFATGMTIRSWKTTVLEFTGHIHITTDPQHLGGQDESPVFFKRRRGRVLGRHHSRIPRASHEGISKFLGHTLWLPQLVLYISWPSLTDDYPTYCFFSLNLASFCLVIFLKKLGFGRWGRARRRWSSMCLNSRRSTRWGNGQLYLGKMVGKILCKQYGTTPWKINMNHGT